MSNRQTDRQTDRQARRERKTAGQERRFQVAFNLLGTEVFEPKTAKLLKHGGTVPVTLQDYAKLEERIVAMQTLKDESCLYGVMDDPFMGSTYNLFGATTGRLPQ